MSEEDIKQLKSLKADRESFLTNDKEHDEIYLKDIQAIENILADREKYKRLTEQNLMDSEEFKNNMCEHRCIKYNEILELQAKANKYDSLVEKIKEEIEELNDTHSDYSQRVIYSGTSTYTQLVQEVLHELLDTEK